MILNFDLFFVLGELDLAVSSLTADRWQIHGKILLLLNWSRTVAPRALGLSNRAPSVGGEGEENCMFRVTQSHPFTLYSHFISFNLSMNHWFWTGQSKFCVLARASYSELEIYNLLTCIYFEDANWLVVGLPGLVFSMKLIL